MIYVLTYNAPHRKTFDTLTLLKENSYKDVTVLGMDFHYKKSFSPLLQHRPPVINNIMPHDLCEKLGYSYININRSSAIPHYLRENHKSIILICGSGIIPEEIISQYYFINAHPAYLPYDRGLDAYKWSIWNGHPIGVTTHLLSSEIDAGMMIQQKKIPIFKTDSFESLAFRQYETEIRMLVEAIELLKTGKLLQKIDINGFEKVNKRMPKDIESKLLEKFQEMIHTPSATSDIGIK